MSDVYERLRLRLDDLATGLPETEDKIEIKLLKRLFTEQEAEFFIQLHPMLESPEVVAKRLDQDPAKVAGLMEQMAKKGLLFRKRDDKGVRYAAVPYVVGIYEFQVSTMDKELARENETYFEKAFLNRVQSFKTPVMRTVPINRMYCRSSKSRKKFCLPNASAAPRQRWPAPVATNLWKRVLCLAPMQIITRKTGWVVLLPWKKPGRSFLKMKKPVW